MGQCLHMDDEHPVSKLDLEELELIVFHHIFLVSIAFDNHAISRKETFSLSIFVSLSLRHTTCNQTFVFNICSFSTTLINCKRAILNEIVIVSSSFRTGRINGL